MVLRLCFLHSYRDSVLFCLLTVLGGGAGRWRSGLGTDLQSAPSTRTARLLAHVQAWVPRVKFALGRKGLHITHNNIHRTWHGVEPQTNLTVTHVAHGTYVL